MFRTLLLFLLLCCLGTCAQETKIPSKFALGVAYGFGGEFDNSDYTYTNKYIQGQLYYTFNPGKKWEYQLALQPEVNFARHRLLNLYFVTPAVKGFEDKREAFTKLKDIHEYVLNVAFFTRYNFTDCFSLYAMGSVGPMITDTETERLTKGFAFCDVFAIGATVNLGGITLDVRPNVRHVSNAGLQDSNAGFNTLNVSFGNNSEALTKKYS